MINQSDAGFVCTARSRATFKRENSSTSGMQQVCVGCHDSIVDKMKQIAAYMCSNARNNACQQLARTSIFHHQSSDGHISRCHIKNVTCTVLLKAEQTLLASRCRAYDHVRHSYVKC